jgi:hypothetical protein
MFGRKSLQPARVAIALAGVCLVLGAVSLQGDSRFRTGEIEPAVACEAEPQQTYALFVPSSYAPSKKWPILYAFDPMKT